MSNFRLGVFVVCALAVLTGGVFLIGDRKLEFRSTYSLRAEFRNAGGLIAGADVRVGGIHMGTVRAIELPKAPDGKVSVRMDLEDKTRAVVKRDSVASIQAEGLVGDEFVEVSFGSKDGAAIRNGDTIAGQPPLEMSALFKKTDSILDEVQDAARSIDGSSKNMEAISGKINGGSGTVGALVNDKSLYDRVNSSAQAFQEDAEALKHNFLLRGFFKNRGYEDSAELTKNEIRQLPSGPYSKEFTLDAKGLFEKPDTARLKNEKELKPVGDFLQSAPFGLAVVAALGSPEGDSSQEKQLTLARAAVVRDYLVKNFRLDDSRIKTIGMAKQAETNSGQVEIMVYSAAPRDTPGGH
jgi:phospholipid/cholesterol/gamma-HCH transport system substrate-binding protein